MHLVRAPVMRRTAIVIVTTTLVGCGTPSESEDTSSSSPLPPTTSQSQGVSGELHEEIPLGDHQFDVYVPASVEVNALTPVVIALHGRPGNSVESQAQLQPLADNEEFLVVYPRVGRQHWQTEMDSDDLDYMRELINELINSWHADPERVYVTGMSAGGDMTISIGLQLSDLVAAVAPVAPPGDPALAELFDTFAPSVPLVAFVGAEDARFADRSLELLGTWREQAGCGDGDRTETDALEAGMWSCDDETDVIVYRVKGQGHVWFGAPEARDPLWASEAMWEFFTTFRST